MTSPGDLGPAGLENPFSLFNYLVPTGGDVLLLTDPDATGPLRRLGFALESSEKDLRLLALPPESLDAVWWGEANVKYAVEDAFRILQIFFRGLRAKRGVLVFSFTHEKQARTNEHHPWNVRTILTLLRQTGFQVAHTFESPTAHLYFCQRL